MTIELARLDPAQFIAIIHERDRDGFSATDIDPGTAERLEQLFHREIGVRDAVREIIADIRAGGDAALREWTYRIDGIDVESVHVDPAAMEAAWRGLEQPLRNALAAAAQRLREFHALQVDVLDRGAGGAWIHPVPLGRAGCYVPGGRAAYPSTVLMSVIPAQVAGVERIVVASPPAPTGGVHPLVAAAAYLLGVREVVAAGGAQAIAALAFGTESIERVDKIVGPGNVFVTLAKHEVFGAVGIDQLAGPSEIVVIATAGADPGDGRRRSRLAARARSARMGGVSHRRRPARQLDRRAVRGDRRRRRAARDHRHGGRQACGGRALRFRRRDDHPRGRIRPGASLAAGSRL